MINLVSSPQTVTASWADLGDEFCSQAFNDVGMWIKLTINDSQNIQFRYLAKHTANHADEYEIMTETITAGKETENAVVHELDLDVDQKVFHHFSLGGEIPFIQVQVRALTAGATGATIDDIKYETA